MSVKNIIIDKLLPNPFRKLGRDYFDEGVIEELVKSMKETGVWAGIIARTKGEKYEIAFGHHRLEAMKRSGVKEAPIDIQNHLSDLDMIKMMAFENMSEKATNTGAVVNVVGAAKEELEKLVAGWATWGAAPTERSSLFENEHGFDQCKKANNGIIGAKILQRFLGDHWRTNIEHFLSLDSQKEEVDIAAVELFDKPSHAVVAADMMVELKIPKKEQRTFIKKIKKQIEESVSEADKARGIEGTPSAEKIRREASILKYGDRLEENRIEKPDLNDSLRVYVMDLNMMTGGLETIFENWDEMRTGLKNEYVSALKAFLAVNKAFIKQGGEEWNPKLLEA